MHIYLIRHASQGSILCNDNSSLSEMGRQQADAVGERLVSYKIQAVYSSDLTRAVETARIINKHLKDAGLNCPHEIRKGLREADFGILTGLTDDTIAKEYRDFMESRYHTEEDWGYPEGENGLDVWTRFEPVLNEIIEKKYESVAVVTHGGTIRCCLAHLFGKGFCRRLAFGKNFGRGSITEIIYDKNRDFFYLERFNDCSHIEKINLPDLIEMDDRIPVQKIGEDVTLVLASGSARRRELLSNLKIPFEIIKSTKEEKSEAYTPSALVKELSLDKTLDVAEKIEGHGTYVILGADTVVVSPNGMVIGKPVNREDAIGILSTLQGTTHSVYTGVTLLLWEKEQGGIATIDSFYCCTRVTINPMTQQEIETYVDSREPFDKAGGYAIQGMFAPYIKRIDGDYYNVVGLPLSDLRLHLRKLGISM